MNELQVNVAIEKGIINTNFDALKANIAEQMQIYKELEVTDNNKAERKKDIAALRKIKKAINDKKTSVKEEFMKPYTNFENNVKEILEIIEKPIALIDGQVKELEDKQRKLKITQIKQLYEVAFGELTELVHIDRIYNDKWENASFTLKQVKEDINDKILKIRSDISLIKNMNSDKCEEALELYYENLDINMSIGHINRYEQQKREIEKRLEEDRKREQERELERERERVREEERQRIREEERIRQEAKQEVITEQQEALVIKQTVQAASNIKAEYTLLATSEELEQLEMYMDSIGIVWERG